MSHVQSTCPQCGSATILAGGVCAGCLLGMAIGGEDALEEVVYEQGIPAPGQNFGGHELQALIGRGGMALVYRAAERQSGRTVALKMVPPQQLHDDSVRERFKAEVQAAAALDHPHILPIYEVGERDGIPYFSMKLATGGALSETAGKYRGQFSEIAILVGKVANALHHAHQRGILHRDVKPGNILLDGANEPFLTDFGIAKSLTAASNLTGTLTVLGTPAYLSPEQAAGKTKELTTATDIYGLGAVLYELLTGHAPFEGGSAVEILYQIERKSPERPTLHDASIPRDLEIICWKCLAREPHDRYATAAALAEDLERWKDGRTIIARPATTPERVWRWSRRNPTVATLLGSLVVLLIAAALISSLVAVRFNRQRKRAESAERLATEELYASYLAQARASRRTGAPGQRFDSLAAVAKAVRIHPSNEARDEAIAALALFDVRLAQQWPRPASIGSAVAFDQSLEHYICELEDHSLSLRRIADQHEIIRLTGPGSDVEYIYPISPDGRFAAAKFRNGEHWLWRLVDGKALLVTPGRTDWGWGAVSISAAGGLFAVTPPDSGVDVYRIADLEKTPGATGAKPWRTFPGARLIGSCEFDPRGERLTISDNTQGQILSTTEHEAGGGTAVYEMATGNQQWNFASTPGVAAANWSSDGLFIAATGWDQNVTLLETGHGEVVRTLRGHNTAVNIARFDPAGARLVSVGLDGQMFFWDAATGERLLRMPGSDSTVRFSPDGRRLGLRLGDTAAGVLEFAEPRAFQAWRPPERPSASPLLSHSADGRYSVTTSNLGVELWNVVTGRSATVIPALGAPWFTAAMVRRGDETLLLAGNMRDGFSTYPLQPPPDPNSAPQPNWLGPAAPWLREPGWRIEGVSRDGRRLVLAASGERDRVIAEVADPSRRIALPGHRERASVSFDREDARIATGSRSLGGAVVWDSRTGQALRRLEEKESAVAAFDPLGRWLATGTRNGYRLWRLDDWSPGPAITLPNINGELDEPALAFSPDGAYLAVLQSGDRIALLDAATGAVLGSLEGPFATGVNVLAFTPDGRWLVSLGNEQAMQRWDLGALREELAQLGLAW